MSFGGGLFHHHSLDRTARAHAQSASSDARNAKTEVQFLESEIERLLMITEALWSVLKEQHDYDDDELVRRVADIDLRDGRLDGRVAKSEPINCRNCGKKLGKRRATCFYCGSAVASNLFER
ncbi:MAG: hypothetical protein QF473_09165 [Planctomycetota bacterium]|nr:hypothetical protein [Planctomycetota bacterium]